jgi:hypothetical protein
MSNENEKKTGIMGFIFPDSVTGLIFRDMVVGNLLLLFGLILLAYWNQSGADPLFVYQTFCCIIISAPIQLKIWLLGGSPFKFWKDYEVVTTTTYGDGRVEKSSDGGAQNMILKLIVAVVFIYVGTFIQVIKLFFLPLKYASALRKEKEKAPIYKNGFLIMLATIVLFIAIGNLANHLGRVHFDKNSERAYNAALKGSSLTPPAEIRSMLEKYKQEFTTGFLDYKTPYGKIIHNGAENITTVDIQNKKLPSNYLAGKYIFKNGVFDRFEDEYKTGKKPSDKQIELARRGTPYYLFDHFLNAKDSDLLDVDINYSGNKIVVRGVDWKNAIFFETYFRNFLDNSLPVSGLRGLRGDFYTTIPTTIARDVKFPMLATVTGTVSLKKNIEGHDAYITLEPGTEIMVMDEQSGLLFRPLVIEYYNMFYYIVDDDKTNVKLSGAITVEKPAAFNRATPFDAIVTEEIVYLKPESRWNETGTIAKGETVTVTGEGQAFGTANRIPQAKVTYNGEAGIGVHWKYLKLAE